MNIRMAEKLLPCPFCGGDADIIAPLAFEERAGYYCCCKKCGVRRGSFVGKEVAISHWNMRAKSEPVAEVDQPYETGHWQRHLFDAQGNVL